jgi:hypothetical protein
MTILFATHAGKTASATQQDAITEALSICAQPGNFYGLLNVFYNNQYHMGQLSSFVHMPTFLHEIQEVANSKEHSIMVMGTEHTDTYGHPSQLIVQYNPSDNMAYPVMAQDTYIRIQLYMPKNPKHYRMLFPGTNYHFLVASPMIIDYPLGPNMPIDMFYVPDERLLPRHGYVTAGGSHKKSDKIKSKTATRKKTVQSK